jgi:hypothetical protein
LIDRSQFSDDEKKIYSNLLRAQLSNDELKLLFSNCLSDKGKEKFKPLVEKYAMLKTLYIALNEIDLERDKPLFADSAFGK